MLPIVGAGDALVVVIIVVELLLVGSMFVGARQNFTFIVLVWLCSGFNNVSVVCVLRILRKPWIL